MKLIDADALIKWLGDNTKGEWGTVKQWFESFKRVLEKFPAYGGAVAVTRCKDCKHYPEICVGFGKDGYCSEAERRKS